METLEIISRMIVWIIFGGMVGLLVGLRSRYHTGWLIVSGAVGALLLGFATLVFDLIPPTALQSTVTVTVYVTDLLLAAGAGFITALIVAVVNQGGRR
ncbi:MAG: hypothetical protein CL610_00910 [Anaerolineaceae bacterium]|nr:hypothetical protein [Anaerolineaceae bacterium]